MVKALRLTREQAARMEAHMERCLPEEGCGLIAGTDSTAHLIIPITNQYHSPLRYNMDPQELVEAFYDMKARDFEMLASFHSHPNGPSAPSPTDLMEFAYPGTAMLIWSKEDGRWQLRGFEITAEDYLEIELQISG